MAPRRAPVRNHVTVPSPAVAVPQPIADPPSVADPPVAEPQPVVAPQSVAAAQPGGADVEDFFSELRDIPPELEELSDSEDEHPVQPRRARRARQGAAGAGAEPPEPVVLNDPDISVPRQGGTTHDLRHFFKRHAATGLRQCTLCLYVLMS